eukprot:g674.t1
MRSQASAADPTPGAFGGAQPSPGAAFSSMKSQASAVAPGSVARKESHESWGPLVREPHSHLNLISCPMSLRLN